MAQTDERPITLPVLDRLLDMEPGNSTEVAQSRTQSLRALRAAVRRDLEWLLNSRRIAIEPDPALEETARSVYVLGLADIASFSLADGHEQSRLLSHIQSVIHQFEPRLASVHISPQDEVLKTRSLRFRIDASLLVDPAPERISFDTVLDPSSGEYIVREDS